MEQHRAVTRYRTHKAPGAGWSAGVRSVVSMTLFMV